MTNKISISVIIPIYNVENYIAECINSVISQTYTNNFECLLIDDCGTDNSINIVKEIISQYKGNISFELIQHEKNKGLSAARNTGINKAKGKYIFFLDSDDWIYPQCLEKLVSAIEIEKDIDYAIGDYHYDSTTIFPPLKLKTGIYKDNILELYTQEMFYMMAWNKLYKTEFITQNNLTFKEGLLHEDVLWSFCCACHSTKISVIKDITLFYRIRPDSIQNGSKFILHHVHYCTVFTSIVNYIFYNKLQNNKYLYEYINKQIKWLFISPFFEQHIECSKLFYYKFRKGNYWSLVQILKFNKFDWRKILIHFHRYMPPSIGYKYFSFLFLRFYDK